MSDRDDLLQKSDIETVLETNKKAIEIHTEVASQNEDIINKLESLESKLKYNTDLTAKMSKDVDDMNKSMFKLYVLLTSGVISLIIQIISMVIAKH